MIWMWRLSEGGRETISVSPAPNDGFVSGPHAAGRAAGPGVSWFAIRAEIERPAEPRLSNRFTVDWLMPGLEIVAAALNANDRGFARHRGGAFATFRIPRSVRARRPGGRGHPYQVLPMLEDALPARFIKRAQTIRSILAGRKERQVGLAVNSARDGLCRNLAGDQESPHTYGCLTPTNGFARSCVWAPKQRRI